MLICKTHGKVALPIVNGSILRPIICNACLAGAK